jgi:peptidoglycan biosynthesis protein MviN/MurJ (putative lipid II flippase)
MASLVALMSAFVLVGRYELGVEGFVFGMIIGHTFGFLLVAYGVWILSEKRKFAWKLRWKDSPAQEFLLSSLATGGVNVAYYFMIMIERVVASFVFPGAITLLNMGKVFITMMGAIHGSFSNAYYKKLVSSAISQIASLPSRLRESLKISAVIGFPIVIVAFLLHKEILHLLFSSKDYGGKGQLLDVVALAIIAGFPHVFMLGTLVRIFQSLSRLKQVLYHYGFATVLYLMLAPLGVKLFGVVGLAAAYSITLNIVTAIMFIHLMRLGGEPIFDREFWRVCLAGVAALLATGFILSAIGANNTLVSLGMGSILSALTFIGFGRALNIPYLSTLLALVKRRHANPNRNLDRPK